MRHCDSGKLIKSSILSCCSFFVNEKFKLSLAETNPIEFTTNKSDIFNPKLYSDKEESSFGMKK